MGKRRQLSAQRCQPRTLPTPSTPAWLRQTGRAGAIRHFFKEAGRQPASPHLPLPERTPQFPPEAHHSPNPVWCHTHPTPPSPRPAAVPPRPGRRDIAARGLPLPRPPPLFPSAGAAAPRITVPPQPRTEGAAGRDLPAKEPGLCRVAVAYSSWECLLY